MGKRTDERAGFWTMQELDKMKGSIYTRWGIQDWGLRYPWWGTPAKVRLLLYGDSGILKDGSSFIGLTYVKTLLESRAFYYVDFDITTVDRNGLDPGATIPGAKDLTELDVLDQYDEIWFFGFNENPNLSAAELTVLNDFMSAPKFGGVLVTGDHADLGKGIAGQIPRAGVMRQYPAPPIFGPTWNTTLEEGPDSGSDYNFNDQSDDRPQEVRYRLFRMPSLAWNIRRYRPHPVLCGPDGPIDVFPDHQHEGEALAPIPAAGDPIWPTKNGHQEQPVVIGWGRIKDPNATKVGQEIGLVSAYDGHTVDVGRILADSTWHHWFDINLLGISPSAPYAGFDATPAGQAALKKIDAYFLNCGVWLAPPDRQAAMRNVGWSSILWTDQVVELSKKAPLWYLGGEAIDVLGRRASRCTVTDWIFDDPIFKEKIPWWEWPQFTERLQLISLPFEQYLAGGMLRELMEQVGPWNSKQSFPSCPPDAQVVSRCLTEGAQKGLAALGHDVKGEMAFVAKLVETDFKFSSACEKAPR